MKIYEVHVHGVHTSTYITSIYKLYIYIPYIIYAVMYTYEKQNQVLADFSLLHPGFENCREFLLLPVITSHIFYDRI